MNWFLVQVWVPADETPCGEGLRGMVRNLGTGTEHPFRNDEEVLFVLRTRRDSPQFERNEGVQP